MQTTSVRAPAAGQGRLRVFTALRHRNYRYYWFGMVAAITGLQVLFAAQAWLVYERWHTAAYLGLVGAAQALPVILLNVVGGAVADRVDRRRLLLYTQSGNALIVLALALLVSSDQIQIWHLVLAGVLAGALQAFDQPARMALVPQLVERADLTNAIALQSMVWQGTRIVGPAIGGLLIATVGIATCFYLTAAAVGVMVLAILKMEVAPGPGTGGRGHLGQNMAEGVAYVLKTPVFAALIGMTFINSVFGMSYVILVPVFAQDILKVDASSYGMLMAASGVGALMGSTTVAYLGNFRYRGPLLITGAALFGLSLVVFAFSPLYLLSVLVLLFSGVVNSLYMTTVNTSLQALVPDELRGRVMGIYSLSWGLLPLGGLLAGGVATVAGAPVAVALGGVVVVATATGVAAKLPQVRNLAVADAPAA
ncbi:MAG: MFS transporter [Chloroflexi bacterium]|nr:MFS transporter [Chloroflexota bacterium]